MGQEEAASGGRFVSRLAPVRKTPNGTDGKRAPCACLARAIRRANRAGANAGARAHAIRAKKGRATLDPERREGNEARWRNDMQDGDKRTSDEVGGGGCVPAEHDKT